MRGCASNSDPIDHVSRAVTRLVSRWSVGLHDIYIVPTNRALAGSDDMKQFRAVARSTRPVPGGVLILLSDVAKALAVEDSLATTAWIAVEQRVALQNDRVFNAGQLQREVPAFRSVSVASLEDTLQLLARTGLVMEIS